jgi:hypothetical protein
MCFLRKQQYSRHYCRDSPAGNLHPLHHPPGVFTSGIKFCFKAIPASFISLPGQISPLVVGDADTDYIPRTPNKRVEIKKGN